MMEREDSEESEEDSEENSEEDSEENITSAALLSSPSGPQKGVCCLRDQCYRHLFTEPHDWLDVKHSDLAQRLTPARGEVPHVHGGGN